MQVFSRRLFGLLSVLIAAVAIAACGGGNDNSNDSGDSGGGSAESTPAGRDGGEATFAYASFPDYLDPALSYTVAGWQALADTNLPLLTYKRAKGEEGAKLIPGLAEAMPEVSSDGKTYTLTLRDGLKYSDGSPVKANDFEHTIKRVINLESGGSSFYTGNIVGAEEYEKAGKAEGRHLRHHRRRRHPQDHDQDQAGERVSSRSSSRWTSPAWSRATRRSRTRRRARPRASARSRSPSVATGRSFVMEKNANYPEIEGLPAGEPGQDHDQRGHAGPRAITDVLQNKADYFDDPPPAATPCASSATRLRSATAARSRTRPTTTS